MGSEAARPKLAALTPGPACSDAERRNARRLARALHDRGERVRVETFWGRPRWAPTWALHTALAVVGTLVAVSTPAVGLAICAATLISFGLELGGRRSPLAWLAVRRATQNVLCTDSRAGPARVVMIAPYDSAPRGAVCGRSLERLDGWLERSLAGHAPGFAALCFWAIGALTVLAGARADGLDRSLAGALSLVPAGVLILATFALLDLGPSEGEDPGASAPALALLELLEELRRHPPQTIAIDAVFCGAAHGRGLGMHAWLSSHRDLPRDRTVVVVLAASERAGYVLREGALLAGCLHPQLIELCARIAAEPGRGLGRLARRRPTGALQARRSRFPTIAIGVGAQIEPSVELCADLVELLDDYFAAIDRV